MNAKQPILLGVFCAVLAGAGVILFLIGKGNEETPPPRPNIPPPIIHPLPTGTTTPRADDYSDLTGKQMSFFVLQAFPAENEILLRFLYPPRIMQSNPLLRKVERRIAVACALSESFMETITLSKDPDVPEVASPRVRASEPIVSLSVAGDTFSGVCGDAACESLVKECVLKKVIIE